MLEPVGAQPRSSLQRARVLIAEDDQTASAIYVRALANAGFEASVAVDGNAAMEMLRQGEFDVVVSDRYMPGMDGLELVRTMRADSRLTRLPVLFLTSASDHDTRTESYTAGCDAFLVKPVRPKDLIDRVTTLVSQALGTGAQLSGAYLQGRLDGMTVSALLSFLHAQERSGLLRFWRFGAYGEITLRQGQLLNAVLDSTLEGEEALTALLGWNAGTFRFERHDVSELECVLRGSFAELMNRAEARRSAV